MTARKLMSAILVISLVAPAAEAAAQVRVLRGAQMRPAQTVIRPQTPRPQPQTVQRPAPRPEPAPSSDWVTLYRLESGSNLTVTLRKGTIESGSLRVVDEASITLDVQNKPVTMNRDDVVMVELTKNTVVRNVVTGGVGGAGAGLVIIALAKGLLIPVREPMKLTTGLAAAGAANGAIASVLDPSTTKIVYRAN